MHLRTRNVRPPRERRAFSLLELVTVVAIIGILSGMASVRWGENAFRVVTTDGFASRIKMSLHLARRQAIAEGVVGAVVFSRESGAVTSFRVVRVDGGDLPTDVQVDVPDGVTVTPDSDRWEYDYTGTLTTPVSGGSIAITDGDWNWDLTVNAISGYVELAKAR